MNASMSMESLNVASSAYVGKNIKATQVDRQPIAVSSDIESPAQPKSCGFGSACRATA